MRTFPIFAFFLVAAILMFHFPTEFTANAAKVSATPIFVDSQSTSHDSAPRDLAFNTDGTKMFVTGNVGDDINEYICTTGFDVTSCDLDTVDDPLDDQPKYQKFLWNLQPFR